MNSKEYKFSDGRTAVFEYDENGIGKITLECMDALMGMITQQWIPCSDRLPDKDFTDFLVQIGHGKYAIYETAYRVRGRWVFYSDRIDGEGQSVIAWMECPSPYKGEDQ